MQEKAHKKRFFNYIGVGIGVNRIDLFGGLAMSCDNDTYFIQKIKRNRDQD